LPALKFGNPGLEPEEVTSFDISTEWYFAEAAIASIGYFHKTRTNIIAGQNESASLDANGLRETNPECLGGGLWNTAVQPNVLGNPDSVGLGVDVSSVINDSAETTQSGIEMSFQYDLSNFKKDLVWHLVLVY